MRARILASDDAPPQTAPQTLAVQSISARPIRGPAGTERVCRNVESNVRQIIVRLAPKGAERQISEIRSFMKHLSDDLSQDTHLRLRVRGFVGGIPRFLEYDLVPARA